MNEREYQLSFCNRCKNYTFDINRGVVCGVTKSPPNFHRKCPGFEEDPERLMESQRQKSLRKQAQNYYESGGWRDFEVKEKVKERVILAVVVLASVLFLSGFFSGWLFLVSVGGIIVVMLLLDN